MSVCRCVFCVGVSVGVFVCLFVDWFVCVVDRQIDYMMHHFIRSLVDWLIGYMIHSCSDTCMATRGVERGDVSLSMRFFNRDGWTFHDRRRGEDERPRSARRSGPIPPNGGKFPKHSELHARLVF